MRILIPTVRRQLYGREASEEVKNAIGWTSAKPQYLQDPTIPGIQFPLAPIALRSDVIHVKMGEEKFYLITDRQLEAIAAHLYAQAAKPEVFWATLSQPVTEWLKQGLRLPKSESCEVIVVLGRLEKNPLVEGLLTTYQNTPKILRSEMSKLFARDFTAMEALYRGTPADRLNLHFTLSLSQAQYKRINDMNNREFKNNFGNIQNKAIVIDVWKTYIEKTRALVFK